MCVFCDHLKALVLWYRGSVVVVHSYAVTLWCPNLISIVLCIRRSMTCFLWSSFFSFLGTVSCSHLKCLIHIISVMWRKDCGVWCDSTAGGSTDCLLFDRANWPLNVLLNPEDCVTFLSIFFGLNLVFLTLFCIFSLIPLPVWLPVCLSACLLV